MNSYSSFLKNKLAFVSFITLVSLASSSLTFAMDGDVQITGGETVEEAVEDSYEQDEVQMKPDPCPEDEVEQKKTEKNPSRDHKRKRNDKNSQKKKPRVVTNPPSMPDFSNMPIPLTPSSSGLELTYPPAPLQNPPGSPPSTQTRSISNLGDNGLITEASLSNSHPSGVQLNQPTPSFEEWFNRNYPLTEPESRERSNITTTHQVSPASQSPHPILALNPPPVRKEQIGNSQRSTPNFANYGPQNSAMMVTVPGNSAPMILPEGGWFPGGQPPVTTAAPYISLPTTTTTPTTNTVTNPAPTPTTVVPSNQLTLPSLQTRDPFLEEIDRLIEKAKNQDQEAQDDVIEMFTNAKYADYLTPDKIGFNQWSLKDTLKSRCYNNGKYAAYVICYHSKVGKAFPNLWDVVSDHAEAGDMVAQNNLGLMYKLDLGVGGKSEANDKRAVEWFTTAANQEFAPAQNNLGVMYREGRGVVGGKSDANDKIAVEWFTKAARQGNSRAQNNLGWMYQAGRGVVGGKSDANDKIAVEWLTKAAYQGGPEPQFNLGVMYREGRGVVGGKSDANDKIAVEWFTKASHQGYAKAQNNLGLMYQEGRGVEKNYVTALYYMMSGKKSDNQSSRDFLSAHLFYLPFSGEEKESCKEEWIKITTGKPLQNRKDLQEGLVFLYKRHQDKIAQEEARDFPIPGYLEHYKKVLDIEQQALKMVKLLKTLKPGFMVPGLYFSEEALKHYYTQAEPRQVAHWISGDTVYLTFGEENIKLQNRLVAYLDHVDEDFKKADTALKKLDLTYYNQAECEKAEKDLMTKRHDPDQKEECQRLSEKITKLREPLNEIEKDRTELSKTRHHLKTLIRSTGQGRQDEFLKEYPFFKRKF